MVSWRANHLHKRPLIYVLGDINRELCLHLHSFPKPGREHHVEATDWTLGGSAVNIAAALVRLRIPTGVIGRVGMGKESQTILREMARVGIQTRAIQKDSEKPTGICVIPVTADGKQTWLEARGANSELSLDGVREALQGSRHLHISGNALVEPGTRPVVSEALLTAREMGVETSLDFTWPAAVKASEPIRKVLPYVSVALASAPQLRVTMGIRKLSQAAMEALALGAHQVVATLGAGGCRVFAAEKSFRVPSFESFSGDMRGTRDTFTAGYIFGLLEGAQPLVCAVLASAAGAVAVGRGHPCQILDSTKLVSILRDIKADGRQGRIGDALLEAVQLLTGSSSRVRRKKRSKSKSRKDTSLPESSTAT